MSLWFLPWYAHMSEQMKENTDPLGQLNEVHN